MSCEEVCAFLDAYTDRELDVMASLQFERHFAECARCRAVCEEYEQLSREVRTCIPRFDAPQGLERKIRAELHLGNRPSPRPKHIAGRNWRSWAFAASFTGLLVSSAIVLSLLRRPVSDVVAQEVVSSHIRSLMANHLSDVASSDQHIVKPWFSGKLDFAPVVKDLSTKGFPLEGGRLDYLDNRPVAALVYKHRQHTINLFLWPSSQSDFTPRTLSMKGYNVVHWTQSRMAYWAVSDLNRAELNEFARELRAAGSS